MLQQNPHTNDDVLLGLQFSVIHTLESQSLVHYMRKVHCIEKIRKYKVSLFSMQWKPSYTDTIVSGQLYFNTAAFPNPRFNSETNSVFLHSRNRTIPVGDSLRSKRVPVFSTNSRGIACYAGYVGDREQFQGLRVSSDELEVHSFVF